MASESNSRTSSPTTSRINSPEPQPQQERQQSRRRNRSRTPRSPSVGTSSDSARATRRRRRGQQGPLDDLQNPGQLAQNSVGGLTNTAQGLTSGPTGAQQQEPGGSGGKDTLKLRLDINLDIEVTIKAKVHGDVTLSLLYVRSYFLNVTNVSSS